MTVEIKVPDIGDFSDVPVVSILVSVGDVIAAEDPIVELESDKATMEVPASSGGKVVEIKVAEGDKVSEGAVLLIVEGEGAAAAPAVEAAAPAAAPSAAPVAASAPAASGGPETPLPSAIACLSSDTVAEVRERVIGAAVAPARAGSSRCAHHSRAGMLPWVQ